MILLCLIVIPWTAQASAIFSKTTTGVSSPHQRALIHYSDGVERLVIETSLVGEGTNFAWIIPLPSVPEIEQVGENFFPSVNSAYRPKLVHKPYLAYGCMLLSLVVWIGLRSGRLLDSIGLFVLLLLIGAIAMPNFVGSRPTTLAVSPLSILDQRKVGIYDTVTFSGPNGSAVLDWLNANKFETPAGTIAIISNYAAKGWVFVAATVHRPNEEALHSQVQPLAFTFKTERPIYPLPFTGIENGKCTIELFVFGPGRAHVENFKAQYCGAPVELDLKESSNSPHLRYENFAPPSAGEFRMANPEVRQFALPAPVTTKLIGTLSASEMQTDASIEWDNFKPLTQTVYSQKAAVSQSFAWFVGIVLAGGLFIRWKAVQVESFSPKCAMATMVMIAALFGVTRYATMNITEVRTRRSHHNQNINDWRQLAGALDQYAITRKEIIPLTFEELVTALDDLLKFGAMNTFTGNHILNEPSPGNITLEEGTNSTTVIWYDINGNSHVMTVFRHNAS